AGATCGVGSVRACDVPGLGTVRETVLWWSPNHGHAFRAESKRLGITDHVVVFTFEPISDGDTVMTMRHYWTRDRWFGRFAPYAMSWLMNRLFRNIRENVGGFVTQVVRPGVA
ncbi:MAG: SRPBCC family protein, partial [Myxococcota bacterium]